MKVNIDEMTNNGERFYRTVRYDYNPLFRMDMKDVDAEMRARHRAESKAKKDKSLTLDFK